MARSWHPKEHCSFFESMTGKPSDLPAPPARQCSFLSSDPSFVGGVEGGGGGGWGEVVDDEFVDINLRSMQLFDAADVDRVDRALVDPNRARTRTLDPNYDSIPSPSTNPP